MKVKTSYGLLHLNKYSYKYVTEKCCQGYVIVLFIEALVQTKDTVDKIHEVFTHLCFDVVK